MKCDKCKLVCFSLIKLRDKRKSKRMKKESRLRDLKKVCVKCATELNRGTKTKKPLYNFGSYWSNILSNTEEAYFNRRNGDNK
jgi:hypothetical protein